MTILISVRLTHPGVKVSDIVSTEGRNLRRLRLLKINSLGNWMNDSEWSAFCESVLEIPRSDFMKEMEGRLRTFGTSLIVICCRPGTPFEIPRCSGGKDS